MSQRWFAFAGVVLAGAFGIFTSYSAFQPELKRIKDERENQTFSGQHDTPAANSSTRDNAISQAIFDDIREAKREVREGLKGTQKGGFAWGFRQWYNGTGVEDAQAPSPDPSEKGKD